MKGQLKRILELIGIGAVMLAAAACGGGSSSSSTPSGSGTQAPTAKLIVGAIHVGSVNDNGYNEAMHLGLEDMKKNVPGVQVIEAENIPESADVSRVIEDMIRKGAKLIFPMSFGYLDPALAVAAKHPDVVFEHPAGNKLAPNLGTFWSDTTAMEYLMGVVAGKSTKSNKLGWVIGFPIPNILTSVNAFELGARSVNPNATTQVIVDNAWVDPAKEAEAVNALADSGVDVVTMIVDSPATVVETAQKRGIMSIGFHCLCVQSVAGNGWLTGIGFTWGPLFTQIPKDVMAGTWKSENNIGTLASGYAQIAPYGPKVADATKTLVDQDKAALVSGQLQVFKGPIKDNKGNIVIPDGQVANISDLLGNTNYLVEGVSGNIK